MDNIKKNIEDVLCWDKRLEGSQIRVEEVKGRVILMGTVLTFQALETARNDALIVPGVVSVDNRLKIRSRAQFKVPSDQAIRERIRKFYSRNPDISYNSITIHVVNRKVVLEGCVNSYWTKMLAQRIAHQVIGVTKVLNDLSVKNMEKQQPEMALP